MADSSWLIAGESENPMLGLGGIVDEWHDKNRLRTLRLSV
jgi:hypothetical protein